ncbi:DoxX family membrane protein [Bacteroidota bacterium]
MNQSTNVKWQTGVIVALRILIGWHLLYEGFYKLTHAEWSSSAFLGEAIWIFSGIADWIVSNQGVLNTVDFLNTWGLIAIGLGLMLGLFTRVAAISGTALLMMYYLFNPPFVGITTLVPMEGNYIIVNKTLIEAVTLLALVVFPAAKCYGLDSMIKWKKQ